MPSKQKCKLKPLWELPIPSSDGDRDRSFEVEQWEEAFQTAKRRRKRIILSLVKQVEISMVAKKDIKKIEDRGQNEVRAPLIAQDDRRKENNCMVYISTRLFSASMSNTLSFDDHHVHQTYQIGVGAAPALAVTGILLYITGFSLGMGAVPWVIMSESCSSFPPWSKLEAFSVNDSGTAGAMENKAALKVAIRIGFCTAAHRPPELGAESPEVFVEDAKHVLEDMLD
ncbi:hypothetical protein Ccrd_017755 [Cynara cardunculus var. scolymus]|uniref:Uncharacterized protein n=1 Tax=Cynara cardunculus var. scolymus TaxID=59895 RepID=A0A103Y7J6_CYNCS|nr:hypothetical protein Ccrd_017755 [Cynara cardunculus var. scolymus]